MRFTTAIVLAFIATASTVEAVRKPSRLESLSMVSSGARMQKLYGSTLGGRDYDLSARDDIELIAREPRGGRKLEHLTNGFGALTGAAQLYQNLKSRDDFELVAREPRVRIGNKLQHLNDGIGAVNGAVELYKNVRGREYDDLYELVAREPRVRSGRLERLKPWKKSGTFAPHVNLIGIGNKLEHLNNGFGAVNGAVELYKNLKGRDAELYAREPRVRIGNKLEHLNNGFGAVNGAVSLYKNLKGRDEVQL
ncbi:hypothetical protein NLI96_g8334 [Meripilus lineatus]|uniref:Uncharacterized protein n=1 Tax=Meripilus lineatus TaxID=2056292 RepID=A0AAD5YGE0_9APHY|nr:hypothetical protein NLI96_g8334 [Physisporinus lineatus]